jgi:hypothetical protein
MLIPFWNFGDWLKAAQTRLFVVVLATYLSFMR